MTPQKRLKFGKGNAKLDGSVLTFSLPAGHTCPFAEKCLSKAHRKTGAIRDGRLTEFRCFSATSEGRPTVREARWHNFDLLRGLTWAEQAELILGSLSPPAGAVRVHVSGDFFSQGYFDAWLVAALQRPRTLFYAYTKALPFWLARKDDVPENLVLTASYGGTHDRLIEEHGLKSARVVYSEREAEDLGLGIDHDDSWAMRPGPSFALLLHGTQPRGLPSAKALAALRAEGEFGYGRRADERRVLAGRA